VNLTDRWLDRPTGEPIPRSDRPATGLTGDRVGPTHEQHTSPAGVEPATPGFESGCPTERGETAYGDGQRPGNWRSGAGVEPAGLPVEVSLRLDGHCSPVRKRRRETGGEAARRISVRSISPPRRRLPRSSGV